MAEDKIKDEFIEAYVNKAITEEILRNLENGILEVLKSRYEFYPTEINNKEWLDYTNFIYQRRSQQEFKQEMAED